MEEIEKKICQKDMTIPFEKKAVFRIVNERKIEKNQIHYHTQMDTVPVLIPSQAAVL
jgi:hypothetical protein